MLHAELSGVGWILTMPRTKSKKKQGERHDETLGWDMQCGPRTWSLGELHGFGVPVNHGTPVDTEITQ
jgi:hypothetical protein